jgi:hypothetical protein
MKRKCFLITVCGICLFLNAGATQPDSINTLKGIWVLDSVDVKQITTSGDTINIAHTVLVESPILQSEIITSMDFNNTSVCKLMINGSIIMSEYVYDINNLFLRYNNSTKTFMFAIHKKQMNIARNIVVENEFDPSITDFIYILNLYYHENN